MTKLPPPDLLDEIRAFLERFIAYPGEYDSAIHALWVAHTHPMEAWDTTPRLALLSPEPGSGKTRALELTELFVPRPILSFNASPAYIFREVGSDEGPPTLLYDEIDTVFSSKASGNEDLRGLLNAGYRQGASAGRCVLKGKDYEPEDFPAYCAVALVGLGNLPDTILSRSITIKMRRRAPKETVEAFRRRIHEAEAHHLRDQLADWAGSIAGTVMDQPPKMPAEVTYRNADVWEALIAVADAAGGHWPKTARVAAVTYVTASKKESLSLRAELLRDIKTCFCGKDRITSADLVIRLLAMPEGLWSDLDRRPLNQRKLADLLKEFGIRPETLRIGERTQRGYERPDFEDAWERYLPSTPEKA